MIEALINNLDNFQLHRTIKFLNKFKFDTIIDIGAHKGEFIKYSLIYLNPRKIYAFEPQKDINRLLKKRFKNNKVRISNLAIGKKIKKTFYILINLKKHPHYREKQFFQNLSSTNLKIYYFEVKIMKINTLLKLLL